MTNLDDIFVPMDEGERINYEIEALTVSIQLAIQKAMHEKSMSQKQLAERLGVTPARVSQMLSSSGPNLTLKVLGRIAHALGEEFELISVRELVELRASRATKITQSCEVVSLRIVPKEATWVDQTANINKFPYAEAV